MKNDASYTIRMEMPEDNRETEMVVREAFWDLYRPGCIEHLVIHKIRKVPAYIKELDMVACDGNKIVGIVICPKGKIINEQNQEFAVLSLMVGVLPQYQKKGIGSMLIKRAIEKARSLYYKGIVIFGNPEYYARFGFKNAKEYAIQTSDGENFDPFMALELVPDSLKGINGKFYEDSVFQPASDTDELDAFDKLFPYKEKHVTDTQLKQ